MLKSAKTNANHYYGRVYDDLDSVDAKKNHRRLLRVHRRRWSPPQQQQLLPLLFHRHYRIIRRVLISISHRVHYQHRQHRAVVYRLTLPIYSRKLVAVHNHRQHRQLVLLVRQDQNGVKDLRRLESNFRCQLK
jgi:hypothetical protein